MGQDARPFLIRRQLLRSIDQPTKERGDAGEHALGPRGAPVRAGDTQRGLAAVAGALGDAREQ